jgi:hypothetical protein
MVVVDAGQVAFGAFRALVAVLIIAAMILVVSRRHLAKS